MSGFGSRRDDAIRNVNGLRRAARAAGMLESTLSKAAKPLASKGFPYRKPNVPRGVEVPREPSKLGANFDTEWARSDAAVALRRVLTAGPLRLFTKAMAAPTIKGVDRLDDLRRADPVPPLIFTPNHHSHLDTPLSITSIPAPWRNKLIVAAAADYFFTSQLKGVGAALMLNALPIDRESTGRKSSDQIRDLIADGWSLLIYPEGGRSPDGWGQDFKGGAAYLSSRTGAAVVPMFIDGTGAIFGKGMKRPKPGRTVVIFGRPMHDIAGESTRRFNARIEAAVTLLGDESLTDFWTARRNAANGASPTLSGPEYTGWRRQWALSERRELGDVGVRRRQNRRWPNIG